MIRMWSSREEIDMEKAIDYASKLVLLGSAQKAGIFEALSEEKDIASLKSMLQADERALYIVLESLSAIGFVNKKGNKYIIAEKARSLFIESGEDYVGGFLPHFMDIMKAWLSLPEIIKGEKPKRESEKRNIAAFMNAMASKDDKVVEEVVKHCLKRKKDAKNVLDLGGGPGKYAKVFVNKGLNVVLYDLPDAIDYVSTHFGLKDVRNLTLKKGDFTEDGFVKEFTGESFDIIFLGNIFHIYSEEENQNLIKRVRNLLKDDGMIAIEDFVRGRSPTAEMFAVNMLANTEGGNTYTETQYRAWLEVASFSRIEIVDLADKSSQLITAFME